MKREIKVVGIISSTRENGNTATLVREVLKGAKEEGALVTEIFLPKYNLKPCIGCLKCTNEGRCPLPDKFEEIRKLVYEADGIVLGSPTYATEYNSILKCFFERLGPYTLYASLLGGKYSVGISTAYGNAAKKVAKNLTNIFKFGIFERSYVSGFLGSNTMVNGEEIRMAESPDNLNKAHDLGIKITRDIRNNNKYHFQNLIMRLVISLQLKPIFQRSILKNKDGRERATYKSLLERGLI
ncbi:flavodoxin family protein [Clostridium sp.]|uniref:flavodoxin family protein n=1 Tax=Clostridium sp. TaxID=1506 RepID=UPI00262ABC06|nr:flavodoxin family protein [Clostridium sp.]